MKLVYIAHPIGGDVDGNLKKLAVIMREIILRETDVIPFAPYVAYIMALDDDCKAERALGISLNEFYFKKRIIHELRIYGDKVTRGVRQEFIWAAENYIPIQFMTDEVKNYFKKQLQNEEN